MEPGESKGAASRCNDCVFEGDDIVIEGSPRHIAQLQEHIAELRRERDLWKLRAEWQEARAEALLAADVLSDVTEGGYSGSVYQEALDEVTKCNADEEAAEAAYVAAGGVVLWLTINN